MANINLVTADRVRIVESLEQLTLPAAEAIVAGAPVRIDPTTGKFTNANGTTTTENRVYGIADKSVAANYPLTAIKKGVIDGFDFAANNYDAQMYLSDTDGRIGDTAGTVSTPIGRVIPATATTLGTAYDKFLLVDL